MRILTKAKSPLTLKLNYFLSSNTKSVNALSNNKLSISPYKIAQIKESLEFRVAFLKNVPLHGFVGA